jgi:O-antigen ligase
LLADVPSLLKQVQFVLYTGLFILVYQLEFTQSQIKTLLVAILLTGVVEGIIGSLQWMTHPGLYAIGTIDYGHNLFAAYVTFLAVVMVGVALETRNLAGRLGAIAGVAVMIYSIVFSFSRTAYVSLLVSFVAFAAMPVSRVKRVIVPTACLAVAIITLVVAPRTVVQRMQDIVHTATGEYVALSVKFRLQAWHAALHGFAQSPLIGKGAGAFGIEDNFFIKAAAEAGLLGLGAFVALIWIVLRASWRVARSGLRDNVMRGIAVGFVPAAIGGLIVFNLAGDFMGVHRFMGMFWMVLALMLRYAAGEERLLSRSALPGSR